MFQARTYTSFDGLALHVRDYAGPPSPRLTVLCLPGLTRNARDFAALAEHLSRRYRVLCPDLRGRGRSAYAADPMTYVPAVYLRDVAALLDAMSAPAVALIGTSLGGIIAMSMAAVMPQRLLGVVLNDVGPELDAAGMARIGRLVGRPAVFGTWEEAGAALAAAERTLYPDYRDADWVRLARCRFVEGADGRIRPDYDLAIAKPFAVDFAPVDLWPFFASLKTIPTLAIRGGMSDLLSAEVFARMKQVMPRLEQVTVPDRGHVPMLDEPVARDAIDGFLARVPRRLGPFARLARKARGALFAAQLARKAARPAAASSP
jgi:pimeloyl-ACP methyl ester carboxylesterase